MASSSQKISSTEVPSEQTYQKRIRAWSWYDWADHAYITTTVSTFFPPYFIAIAAPAFLVAGKALTDTAAMATARDTASNIYALVVSISLFFAAILAPVIGAFADITGHRKRFLIIFTVIGGLLASLMFVLTTGMWIPALLFFFATQVSLNIALGFNSSLLPHITRPDDMNRVSSLGYAMGYSGGGLLLALNTALYLFSDKIGLGSGMAVRIAFLSVGIWWILFTLPLLLHVPEPPATPLAHSSKNSLRDSFTRIGHTLKDIQRYKELFKMLLAFWLYMEGVGAIILLATAYGAALGLDTSVLIATLLMTQFVAFPYALMYGRIPNQESKWRSTFVSMLLWTALTFPLMGLYANLTQSLSISRTFIFIAVNQVVGFLFSYFIGRHLFAHFTQSLTTKKAIVMGLIIYCIIPIWGFFLRTQAEFFMIGWMVGTVQGGTQALSRTIYAALTPRAKSGEFFGFFGLSEKFAGILGPLLYSAVGSITHDPRDSILSIVVFFLLGIYILIKVDVAKGTEIAQAEEMQIETIKAAD